MALIVAYQINSSQLQPRIPWNYLPTKPLKIPIRLPNLKMFFYYRNLLPHKQNDRTCHSDSSTTTRMHEEQSFIGQEEVHDLLSPQCFKENQVKSKLRQNILEISRCLNCNPVKVLLRAKYSVI